jgi:CBS domain containing-hemolysin-like protein
MVLANVLTIGGLLLANAFFVAAEFALVKVRIGQIEELVEQGNWAARLTKRALDHLDAYLSACQLGITVASLALGKSIEHAIEPPIHALLSRLHLPVDSSGTLAVGLVPTLALSIGTFLHMALGEQAPKSLAIRSARTLALLTAPPLVLFHYLFWPVIWLLNSASRVTLRLIGLGNAASMAELSHSEEELRHILAESTAGGHLSRTERILIENVLSLEEKTARRIMVPRPDITYLSLSRPLEENLRLARQTGHTRFPLCEEDLTQVLGFVHVKDLFRAGWSDGRPDLRKLARSVPFLPETLHLDQLLVEFQRNQVHLAMLIDEFGRITGMVTLENVLEELVGPIQDEFDREPPPIVTLAEGVYEADAGLPLDRLAELLGIERPESEADTTGGLILDRLGRLARAGDTVDVDGYRLTVLQADPTRIRRVRVERLPSASVAPTDPTPS